MLQNCIFFLMTNHRCRLIDIFLLLFTTTIFARQTHCAGNEEKGKFHLLEVHGVTEVGLDQLYVQLLFGKDEENQSAFSRLHCRLSTFLLVREINAVLEDPKESRKIENWLKPDDDDDNKATSVMKKHSKNKAKKPQKKLGEADAARKEVNLRQLRFLIEEEYKNMKFEGINCEHKRIFKLSELHNILWQMKTQQKDIHQLVFGPDTDDNAGKQYAQRLSNDTGKMHWKAMRQLLDANVGGSILRDRMFSIAEGSTGEILTMKQRLRRVIGDSMFEIAEMPDPLLLRIDLIEKPHLLDLYKRLFSIRVEKTAARTDIVYLIGIPQIVSLIRARKAGQKKFTKEFQRFWDKNVRHLANNLLEAFQKLLDYWVLHSFYERSAAISELNHLLVMEDRNSVMELLKMDKLGAEFKQFLDQTRGAKDRLVYTLAYHADAHAFVLENPELAQLIVGDFSEEKATDELIKVYIQWFTAETKTEYEKGHLAADVLLKVRKLHIKFDNTEARKEWKLYRAMFLIFVDQLEDADPVFLHRFGPLYKQMLYKLSHALTGNGPFDFEEVLSKELKHFKNFVEAEKEGALSHTVIRLDEQKEKHWLDEDHRATIVDFQETPFGERLNQNLGHKGKQRMNAFLVGEDTIKEIVTITSSSASSSSTKELSRGTGKENEIANSATKTSSTRKSSYFECPKQQHKTLSPSDKGFDQLTPYDSYLTMDALNPDLEHLKKMINLHTAIWHYQKTISELFRKIMKKFPTEREKLGKLIKELADIMKLTETTETEVKAKNNILEQKMCKFIVFLHLLKEFLLQITEPGELQNETVEILGEIEKQFPNKELANAKSKMKCDFNNSSDISKNMIKTLDLKQKNFEHLNWLLTEYEAFNLFFCAHQQPWTMKNKLHKLLGAKLLEELERRHPEVLKIHVLQDDVRYHLYKQFVMNRKDSTEATEAENRLLFRISLRNLRWVGKLEQHKFLNSEIQQKVMEKKNWLKQLIFANPTTMTSPMNICLVMDLMFDVKNHAIKDNGKQKDEKKSSKEIGNWQGKDCRGKKHFDWVFATLKEGPETTEENGQFLHSIAEFKFKQLFISRGSFTRFKRLFPKTDISYIITLNNILIRELIVLSLLEKDEERREMNRLGLGFASWFRSMDAQFGKDWAEVYQQKALMHKFDAIFDAHLSELRGNFGLRLLRIQAVIRDLVSNNKLREMDEEAFKKEMEPSDEFIKRWKGKKEVEQWLQNLIREEVLAQLTKPLEEMGFSADGNMVSDEFLRQIWRLNLKEELEQNKEAQLRLPLLFGRERSGMESILKAIPLKVEANELDLIEDKKEVKYEIEKQRKNIYESSKSTGGKNQTKKPKKKRNKSAKVSKNLPSEASEDSGLEASDTNLSSDEGEPSTNKETGQMESASSINELDGEQMGDLTKSTMAMGDGDWEEVSKKKQTKTTAQSDSHGAVGSSTSKDKRDFHPSRTATYFSDYMANSESKSKVDKKGDKIVGKETRKTDLSASKLVEQLAHHQTDHPKKGQIIASASQRPQKASWAHVLEGKPADEGQTASESTSPDEPKSPWGQGKSHNEPEADVSEEKKQTVEKDELQLSELAKKDGKENKTFLSAKHSTMPKVDPSQMMFGSLNLNNLESANQKVVEHGVQLASTQNMTINKSPVNPPTTSDEPQKMPKGTTILEQTKSHFSKPAEIVGQRKPVTILKRPTASYDPLKGQKEEHKTVVSRGKEDLIIGKQAVELDPILETTLPATRTIPTADESRSSIDEPMSTLGKMKSHHIKEPIEDVPEEKKQTAEHELLLQPQMIEEDDDAAFKAKQAISKGYSNTMATPIENVLTRGRTQPWVKKNISAEVESLRQLLIRKRQLAVAPSFTHHAVENLKLIVHTWTQNADWHLASGTVHIEEAILLFSGSYLLQLNTSDSDIDCVVLLPFTGSNYRDWESLYKQFFFGNEIGLNNEELVVPCDLQHRHCPNPDNGSLFCILCKNPSVTSLQKLKGRDQIPMITMKFHGFEFDLLFVPIPMHITDKLISQNRKLYNIPMLKDLLSNLKLVDIIIGRYIDWMETTQQESSREYAPSHLKNDNRYGMLLALSGYRANLLIKKLTTRRIITFKLAYSALKLWTKNNFIYGGKFGFLNGTTLTMLLLQVFLKYSDDVAPDLLFHFFSTYSTWKWPARVKLVETFDHRTVVNRNHLSLDWSESDEEKDRERHFWIHEYRDTSGNQYLAKHAKLIWPVIVPGFPTQNAAFNVNDWSAQAMQREFRQGLEQIEAIRKKIWANQTSEMIWEQWLAEKSFDQKYDHFVAIVCAAQSADQLSKFCDYVEGRIRLQLLFSFGDPRFNVQWMHASPEKVRTGTSCPSGEEARLSSAGQWLCTIWLVGVQFLESGKERNRQIMKEKFTKINFTENNEAAQEFGHNKAPEDIEQNEALNIGQNLATKEVERNEPAQKVERDETANGLEKNELAQEVGQNKEAAQATGRNEKAAQEVVQNESIQYDGTNEGAQEMEWDEPANKIRKAIRQENFAQRIHESFKNQERRASSPRSFQRSYSNNSAESLRGSAVSPRGSPSQNSAESPRQSLLSRQATMPSPSRQDTMSTIGEAGTVNKELELVWAKYLDKAQLQAWLQGMGVRL